MYAGHFAIGLALQARYPKTPPLATMLGVGFLDLLDGALVAARVEHVSPAPDLPLGFSLDFIDWDHSLLMAVVWSAVWGLVFRRHFAVAAAAALSHWFADLLVHNGDLALYPHSSLRFGFGLWGLFPIGSWFIEGAFIVLLMLLARPRSWQLLAFLAVLHVSFSPWLSAMKLIAVHLSREQAITAHGVLVVLGFLVPGLVFTKLLRRQAPAAERAQ